MEWNQRKCKETKSAGCWANSKIGCLGVAGAVRLWSMKLKTNLMSYKGHNYPVWDVQVMVLLDSSRTKPFLLHLTEWQLILSYANDHQFYWTLITYYRPSRRRSGILYRSQFLSSPFHSRHDQSGHLWHLAVIRKMHLFMVDQIIMDKAALISTRDCFQK